MEKASWIEAPMVAECFMNLECKYLWEKEIVQGDDDVMICLEVVGGHIEKDYIEDMFGDKGILYNVHYPINPENVKEKGCDYVAAFCILSDFGTHDNLKVGGPGCVGTIPKYRKKGIGLEMVRRATNILKKEKYDISWIHYTHIENWYKKLGYETVLKWNADGIVY
ncbi:GNAT family N-acetyltransferase [Butyrivibrio sp. INlla16]|uniref:GNAT family N-acetyltransferase n=1 Tax=Butyrivibrio sp. INlla16 TaxID=1520807 RepID=UPI00088EB924|nr:GNAT family N-acetyltransferase [Butyrivibrio sp. INlla16]SDB65108.1 Acetyltransferase (GNAT) domain-containing protein [Butyrivibrio sp. INlla16]